MKKIISMSAWGNLPRFGYGAIMNIWDTYLHMEIGRIMMQLKMMMGS